MKMSIEFIGGRISKDQKSIFEILNAAMERRGAAIAEVERDCDEEKFNIVISVIGEVPKKRSISVEALNSILNAERLEKIAGDLASIFISLAAR